MNGFLPDGGTALEEKRLRLPAMIMMTELCIENQLLKEIQPGQTMVLMTLFGHLFSLLIPMKPEQLLAHFKDHVVLRITNFKVGPPQVGCSGERFRDVLCEVKL